MAEPSEAAKKRACELANAIDDTAMTVRDWMGGIQGPFLALAHYIDEVDRVACRVDGFLEQRGDTPTSHARDACRSLLLPDEPDLVKEAIRAAILTDATDDDSKRLRAELAKRGGKIVWEEK